MILITFSWFIRWMFGFEFSCEYSLCAKGILIKYLSLLLLVSAFLIKQNRLLPKDGASIFASYTMLVNPNTTQQLSHILFFH